MAIVVHQHHQNALRAIGTEIQSKRTWTNWHPRLDFANHEGAVAKSILFRQLAKQDHQSISSNLPWSSSVRTVCKWYFNLFSECFIRIIHPATQDEINRVMNYVKDLHP